MENFVLYEYVYGTYRHTHRSWLQRAAGDFYVYVYIQIRVVGRTMMDVCMKNFVHGTRMALTDTNTLTGNFYVYMWIQIRVLSCTMTNVTERRILNCGTENISRNEHTDFK